MKAQMLVEADRTRVELAHAEMCAGRMTPAKCVHDLIDQATPIAAPLYARQEIDVQMRGIPLVRLRTEIIGVVIPVMNPLHPRPFARIALWSGKARAEARPPLLLVTGIEVARIERAERIAADPLLVLEDEAQLRLERQVRPDEQATQRVGVLPVNRLAILAVVARLEADIVSASLIAGGGGTNDA